MFDAEVRAECLLWLPATLLDEDAFPDGFRDGFCRDLPEGADAPLYAALPELARFAEGEDWPGASEVAEALFRRRGFLVQAATPVRRAAGTRGLFYSGWGHYHTEWLYVDTFEALEPALIAWAAARHQSDMPSPTEDGSHPAGEPRGDAQRRATPDLPPGDA